jgi:hypothetical protein
VRKSISIFLICTLIMMIFPSDWSYALELEPAKSGQEKEEVLTEETSEEQTDVEQTTETSELETVESSEESSENVSTNGVEKEELKDKNNGESSPIEEKDDVNKTQLYSEDVMQEDADFWLVDSAATLTEYLKDSQKLKFRLTNNIDLGTSAFQLQSGTIIDGAGYTITYNKSTVAARGFYTNQANAVIEIRNTQFGNTDGTGAVGYYGIVTGSATNVTLIYDSISYYSTNGQMIYNPNGSVIMRGTNRIEQKGTSAYSQEWAEINYVEVENGETVIEHSSNQTNAFIWSTSTASGNPYANTSQIVVRENAVLDIKTNSNMTYGTLAPSYIVEKNAVFNLDKVTLATGGTRNQFFYSSQTQPVNFSFQENAKVNFVLPLPINLNSSKGGLAIGKNADVSIDVASGGIFTTSASSMFAISMDKAKQVSFSGTSLGTIGLNGANGVNNLSFTSNYLQKIETFTSKTNSMPTQEMFKEASDLSVQGTNFTNIPGTLDSFSAQEILSLKNSQKIIFSEFMEVPDQLGLIAVDETDASISLYGSSVNNGSPASTVKFFLFTTEADTSDLRKAKHIVTLNHFDDQENTTLNSIYKVTIDDLNPNTNYWAQMIVTNQVGESDFSNVDSFTTKPQLKNITADVTTNSAIINGELASDTGKWTDYSNGEELALPGQQAYYGGNYQQVKVEYSKNKAFPVQETKTQIADLYGDKNQKFTTKLNGLDEDVTYYVRTKVTGVSGEEAILAMSPLTQFQTVTEIINVEVPIEMAFQTQNKDLGTLQEGNVSSAEYHVVNKGNVSTKVSITDFTKENVAANQLLLLDHFSGNSGQDELALQMIIDNNQQEPLFLTSDLSNNPLTVGVLNVNEQKRLSLEGKYFNPTKQAVFPLYKMTFKVERNEE